jgi:methylmalonyl-CoA mutase cobalamin-binding subunit
VNPLIKSLIDIYGKVGDFHITPCDGAIPISEADRLAQEAVEQHNTAVAKAERERIIALIGGRLSTHNSFIEHCMDEGVEPSISVLSAASALKAILREIDK